MTITTRKKVSLAVAAAATATGSIGYLAPAAAANQGPGWTNNGCTYNGINTAGFQTASASTFGSASTCSGFKVRLYYTDSKGVNGDVSASNFNGQTAPQAVGPSGSTVRYSCHQARSASQGNWSVVRKVGPGAGSCPSSL